MTPESKIKQKIRAVLATYQEHGVYYFMPVPGGFGRSSLDYLGFLMGHGFAIEAKREGGEPTNRQKAEIARIERSHTPVFVISDVASLTEFNEWCQSIVNRSVSNG